MRFFLLLFFKVIFSIVKALYDNYLGCEALTQQTCIGATQCEWEEAHGECTQEPGEVLDIWAEIAKDIFGGIAIGLLTAWVFSAIMRRYRTVFTLSVYTECLH